MCWGVEVLRSVIVGFILEHGHTCLEGAEE